VPEIMGRLFRADGTAQGGAFVLLRGGNPNGFELWPAAAMDADGDFVIAWSYADSVGPDSPQILAQRFVQPKAWTVMVFSNGDNNLEATALGNLDQMEQVDLFNLPVRCVVEIDRSAIDTGSGFSGARVPSSGIASSNWSDTRRGFVQFDGRTGAWSTPLVTADPAAPEQDMGDDQTLIEFVQWAMAAAPAQHYALVLHDHGNGWRGLSYDDNPSSNLTLAELQAALDAVPRLDVLVLDMCLMQMAETATEVVGEADYLVASEDITYGGALNYDDWLGWLALHPTATAAGLADQILAEDDNPTLSVMDMAQVPALNDAIGDFASTALSSATPSDWDHLKDARREADYFHCVSYRDLEQYMNAVSVDTAISAAIRVAAQAVVAQVNQTVTQHKGRGEGLSIYLPVGGSSVDGGYNGAGLTFCDPRDADGTRWGEYVRCLPDTAWWAFWDADWGETLFGAQTIGASASQPATVESAIDSDTDVDYVKFAGSAGQVLNAEVFGSAGPAGLRPVLTLYAPDGATVLAQVTSDADGLARIAEQTLSQDGDYYLAVTAGGNLDPLNPVQGHSSGTYSLTVVWGEAAVLRPQITLGATSIDFGQVAAGAWADAAVELSNTGHSVLEVTGLALPDGSPFAAPHPFLPLPLRLEPGESMNLPVGVRPTALGIVAETLHITSTDPDEPEACISLRVEGIASTPVWTGNVDDHWELVGNWLAGLTPGPDFAAALEDPAALHPALYQDQGVRGLAFRTAGWTIGGAGRRLAVGHDGIDSANFGTNTVEPDVTLTADSTWTVGDENTLVLNGTFGGGGNTLTKDGAGTLVLNGGQDRTTGLALSVDSGTVSMGMGYGPLVLTDLSINSANATLDLADNSLIVHYTDGVPGECSPAFLNVRHWILSAYADGTWSGPGITSSSAAGQSATYGLGYAQNDMLSAPYDVFSGVPVDSSTVLVKYTYAGDVNLDGMVDDNDVTIMVLNYGVGWKPGKPAGPADWQMGDVARYDGKVDDNDITVLVLNYGAGWKPGKGAPLGDAPVAAALPAAAPEVLMTPDAIPSVPLVEDADLPEYAQAARALQTALGPAQAAGGADAAPAMLLAPCGSYQGSAFLPGSGTSASDDPPLVFLAAASTPLAWSTAEEVAPPPGAALLPDGGLDLLGLPALVL
jgi:autotransporter-associated beta strand protein